MFALHKPLTGISFAVAAALLFAGCPPPRQEPVVAFQTSNPNGLNFGTNTSPIPVQVWNTNFAEGTIDATVSPSDDWILVDDQSLELPPPVEGTPVRLVLQVEIDRRNLALGEHEGNLRITAPGIVPLIIPITAVQDEENNTATLNIDNPVFTYSQPYLLDFQFSLRDDEGNSVVVDPKVFQVTAREDVTNVGAINGLAIKRDAARQLKMNLVLDYTLNLASIDAMEDAAKNVLLQSLNQDALVGVWEFHTQREAEPPRQVAGFTVDKDFLRAQIDEIEAEIGIQSGSVAWDAVVAAARNFGPGNPSKESRYLILFSDGNDTSSVASPNTVVTEALSRGIRVYAIGFGTNENEFDLRDITSRTGGQYFQAESSEDIAGTFERIVRDLEGQYNVRWASLRRNGEAFTPSFTLKLGDDSVFYRSPKSFDDDQYEGDENLGILQFVPSDNAESTTLFLRAVYVPREIRRIRAYFRSEVPFRVRQIGAGDDGVIAGWNISTTPANQINEPVTEIWLDMQSPNSQFLPFATFGPLLRFDFGSVTEDPENLFEQVYIDDTIYPDDQAFLVQGFSNMPPE
jgi:hypothetical protein